MPPDDLPPDPSEHVTRLQRESALLWREARSLRRRSEEARLQYEALKRHFAQLKDQLNGLG